jgi:hypothetical protein
MAKTPAQPTDLIISVTVSVGKRLYEQLKDATPEDAAGLLKRYADRSKGAVRPMFVLLAEWQGLVPLTPLVETPDPSKAKATGGCNVTVGLCGSPCPNNQMPVYTNHGRQFYCDECLITG